LGDFGEGIELKFQFQFGKVSIFITLFGRRKAKIDPGNATMFQLKSGETLKNVKCYIQDLRKLF
jgi:hypothetical protein